MRKPVVLVTGAGGEVGHALVAEFAKSKRPMIALEVARPDSRVAAHVMCELTGSIADAMAEASAEIAYKIDGKRQAIVDSRSHFYQR